jgi:hypothetical protein
MPKSTAGNNVDNIKERLSKAGIRSIDDLARQLDKHAAGKPYPMDCIVFRDFIVCKNKK